MTRYSKRATLLVFLFCFLILFIPVFFGTSIGYVSQNDDTMIFTKNGYITTILWREYDGEYGGLILHEDVKQLPYGRSSKVRWWIRFEQFNENR